MFEDILKAMDEIENIKPLSDSQEINGRYIYPDRWNLLKRKLANENLGDYYGKEIHKIPNKK